MATQICFVSNTFVVYRMPAERLHPQKREGKAFHHLRHQLTFQRTHEQKSPIFLTFSGTTFSLSAVTCAAKKAQLPCTQKIFIQ
jgi:hypothetical protein